jgi:FkbM family methyltransferase
VSDRIIHFDVGSNDGTNSLHWARNHPENLVFAFEPNPFFIDKIRQEGLENYILIQSAVSDFIGKAKFNVCNVADRGCSSLLELTDDVSSKWGGRVDMIPFSQIEVDVIRLDSIIEQYDIKEIEVFHCDSQGSDLKVLQGMGKHLRKIKQGVVESANVPDILYKGQNTTKETSDFLIANGFEIKSTQKNDDQNNEINIYFVRK